MFFTKIVHIGNLEEFLLHDGYDASLRAKTVLMPVLRSQLLAYLMLHIRL